MNCAHLSDEEITQLLLQEPTPQLFNELTRRYQASIIQQCQRQLRDIDAAHDVSQEVWIRVLTKLYQFRGECSFATWLAVIVRNRCQDHIQQNKRILHQEISKKIVNLFKEEIDTEDIVKPTVDILEELLEQISGEEKLLLLLKYQQGWSIKTIQQSLQISESAVKVRLSRTREKMRKLMNKYAKDHPIDP